MYGPEAIRQIGERLAQEQDEARSDELIARLYMVVEEDREELSEASVSGWSFASRPFE